MSWSDDTRCLYCEGRLPLYRKITHGQFCSSAHRKSYWEEQERLAIERLQQTHSSLRSYRSASHQDVEQEFPQEAAAYPDSEPLTQVSVATQPLLEAALELDPAPSLDAGLYPIPDVSESSVPAPELLSLLAPQLLAIGGHSPELVAADPFEYEITRQPLPPSHVSSNPETKPLPEGSKIAVWSYLAPPQTSVFQAAGGECSAEQESEVALCHPRSLVPAVEIRAAGRVGLPPTAALEAPQAVALIESSLQVLEMEPAPVTSIDLEVPAQSDVLLQLLDQQVPHPDRLHALGPFAAHPSVFTLACPPPQQFDATPDTALPAAAAPAITAECQLVFSTEILRLSGAVHPAQGSFVNRMEVSEVTGNPPAVVAAVMPVAESVRLMGTAGLQSLGSNLLPPVQGVFALQTTDSMALDLSAAVCSDIKLPNLPADASASMAPGRTRLLPLTFGKKRKAAGAAPRLDTVSRVLPETIETYPVLPHSGLEPLDRKPPEDALRVPRTVLGSLLRGDGLRKLEPAWAHATGFWHHAPRDLKLLLFAIPALLALAFHPGWPRVASAAPQATGSLTAGFQRALNDGLTNVRQTLENRAAVALNEDFRSGLDNWASPGGSTTEWSFDATGFVRPGPLALYRPSVNLTDYQVQFLGLLDKKALSWVVRAADFDNFYVVKLEVLKPGRMSSLSLTRYAVINGKAQDRHDVNIPLTVEPDTLYRVRMDMRGSDFAVEVQDQIADSWTEARLPRGGIGFFTASGEASRLRWVQITHQYDMLGRLCAYLAPFDTTNGSWKP
jgi:hypothetical protein